MNKKLEYFNKDIKIIKTSKEWEEILNDKILDPDGWRTDIIYEEKFEPCNFYETYITKHEYLQRKSISTCKLTK